MSQKLTFLKKYLVDKILNNFLWIYFSLKILMSIVLRAKELLSYADTRSHINTHMAYFKKGYYNWIKVEAMRISSSSIFVTTLTLYNIVIGNKSHLSKATRGERKMKENPNLCQLFYTIIPTNPFDEILSCGLSLHMPQSFFLFILNLFCLCIFVSLNILTWNFINITRGSQF